MTAIFGIVNDSDRASAAVDRFQDAGFERGEISIVAPEMPEADTSREKGDGVRKVTQGAATGAGAGVLLGGALGWFVGSGAVAFPGVGPLIATGPVLMSVAGGALGGIAGGFIAGLVSLAMRSTESEQVESGLTGGHVLVGVEADSDEEAQQVKRVFETLNASDVTAVEKEQEHSEVNQG